MAPGKGCDRNRSLPWGQHHGATGRERWHNMPSGQRLDTVVTTLGRARGSWGNCHLICPDLLLSPCLTLALLSPWAKVLSGSKTHPSPDPPCISRVCLVFFRVPGVPGRGPDRFSNQRPQSPTLSLRVPAATRPLVTAQSAHSSRQLLRPHRAQTIT